MRRITFLDLLFIIQLLVIGLVITGILPRFIIPFWVAILVVFILGAKLEDGTIFFARSIPFFVAIPITANFDSFNTWRVLSGLIFLKWLLGKQSWRNTRLFMLPNDRAEMKDWLKGHKTGILLILLVLIAILSATQAQNYILSARRIIYFVNLSLVGIIVYNLVGKSSDFGQRLIKNLSIPVIIVAFVGIAQLISTYFMNIFQFVDFWAKKVELGLFGSAWANIALKANTWFAYYGDQLSLRMFSLFPDSHSFPIFLLLGLPAVLAVSLSKVIKAKKSLKEMFFTRASILVVFTPIIFLAAILSGTRGIWAASLGAVLMVLAVILMLKKNKAGNERLAVFKYISFYLLLFFMLFSVAYFIFTSSQFQVLKGDTAMFGKRVASLVDISETSNARRLEIWEASIRSIIQRPLLGVGIGNFPLVVGEDLAQAKAGSSAHNLYLHIAAEMGIPALFIALVFLWFLLKKTYQNFIQINYRSLQAVYFASALIFIPWVLIYSLTDVAIFDERAFLLFVITVGLIFGEKQKALLGA
jgi:O-antigen ligase